MSQNEQRSLFGFLVTVLIISAFFGGWYFGGKHIRNEAVDNNAGTYVFADKYGTTDWHWNTSPTPKAEVKDTSVASR